MKQRENRVSLLFLCMILLFLAGCEHTPTDPHQYGPLQQAVPTGFFHSGNIAYYQCADCGQLFTEQKAEIGSVEIPKLSTDLSVCVNGEPTQLTLEMQDASRIVWSLEGLQLEEGNVITVRDTADHDRVYLYQGEGMIDEGGRVKRASAEAAVSLVATPDSLTLTVFHRGMVVQVNGEQYPMDCADNGTYVSYHGEFQEGDRFTVIDNANGVTYGHDDLAEAYRWNIYDHHRGEAGEFVMDRPGHYLLAMPNDGSGQIYIRKVFAPSNGTQYKTVFSDGSAHPMEETQLLQMPGDLIWLAAKQNGATDTGSADPITLSAYSVAVFLEAGTKFHIKEAATSAKITAEHLTDVFGVADGFRLSGESVEIIQSGTYLIGYLPTCGSIFIEQLSTGSLSDAAREFDKKTATIPSYAELSYTDEIKQLYAQYLRLPKSVKASLRIPAKLETLYQNVLALESTSSGVIYHLNTQTTDQVYHSREELRRAFFTDFYYYIAAYHGTSRLKGHEFHRAGDFWDLPGELDGVDDPEFNDIGYAAGKYFLESASNGSLETQTENGFLGFCYQNGLYREILPFLIRFFAYWRLDEGYATLSNSGADLFAEGWAPIVDIAKFFYFNENTAYVKSARMVDCYTNTAGVVFGLDNGELPDIRLRGYIFEGWYDNPEFSGDPVAELAHADEPVHLYAKWRVDEQQQDRDNADLVSIYIYNLTTNWAVRNANTVGHVKKMYDALTENAKLLVTEYPTLQTYIDRFLGQD